MDSPRQTVTLSSTAWTTIAGHASSAFPEECCGVLVGLSAPASFTVHSAHPCPNRAPQSRHNSFLIDPDDILVIRRLARDSGLDLIGFYHSHPNARAYFSPRDLRQCWPGYPNLVVSVPNGQPPTAKAFLAGSDLTHAAEIPVTIAPLPAPDTILL
ncbi:MAG: hypothetical protein C0504_00510 [Candidatus Solibacter sp.]|nr:hypothetical protein [Candidatus Solibacter sp.]